MARSVSTTCQDCRTDWTHLKGKAWDIRVTYMPDDPEDQRWLTWSCPDCGWQAKAIDIHTVVKLIAWGVPVDDLSLVTLDPAPVGLTRVTAFELEHTVLLLRDQLCGPDNRPVIDSVLNAVLDTWTTRRRVNPPKAGE